eukprot:TRINITY_DN12747_c0_g1_i2.p2 TRINITY_DN12747_c0_g1~~TRINITY_DN12747_c0_g1_i2.p2  ORF type:complete len:117 (+),score=13.88 TRINITY_DN12747_c0_g1_i2:164-514(+)
MVRAIILAKMKPVLSNLFNEGQNTRSNYKESLIYMEKQIHVYQLNKLKQVLSLYSQIRKESQLKQKLLNMFFSTGYGQIYLIFEKWKQIPDIKLHVSKQKFYFCLLYTSPSPRDQA